MGPPYRPKARITDTAPPIIASERRRFIKVTEYMLRPPTWDRPPLGPRQVGGRVPRSSMSVQVVAVEARIPGLRPGHGLAIISGPIPAPCAPSTRKMITRGLLRPMLIAVGRQVPLPASMGAVTTLGDARLQDMEVTPRTAVPIKARVWRHGRPIKVPLPGILFAPRSRAPSWAPLATLSPRRARGPPALLAMEAIPDRAHQIPDVGRRTVTLDRPGVPSVIKVQTTAVIPGYREPSDAAR